MRDFGAAIQSTLLELRLSQPTWEHRGDPCGLLVGIDEPTGYDCEPAQFRSFCVWGGDGVHDGLWIDDINQAHPPFFVLLSPQDFGDPVRFVAASVKDWLAVAADQTFTDEIHEVAESRAIQRRRELGLSELPARTQPD